MDIASGSPGATVFILILAVTLSLLSVPPVLGNPQTRVLAPIVLNTGLGPGSSLNLTIRVSNVGPLPEDMDAWQVRLKLNPGVLSITKLYAGPILHQIADDFGGGVFDTLMFNATTGTVDSNELLDLSFPPSPQPVDAGWTGSLGDLLYVQVRVLTFGISNVTIIRSQLNDIDSRAFSAIFHESYDGVFANVPFNVPPIAGFTITPSNPEAGTNVILDGSTSFDRDNETLVGFSWDFGDGSPVLSLGPEGVRVNHTYLLPGGPFTVTLNVTDSGSALGTARKSILVARHNTPPVAIFYYSPQHPMVLDTVTFDATRSYDVDDDLTPPANSSRVPFRWDFGDGAFAAGAVVAHSYSVAGTYNVTLFVEDNYRLATTNSSLVTVSPGPSPDFAISPNSDPLRLVEGSDGVLTMTLTSLNNFTGTVGLSLANSMVGLDCSLDRDFVYLGSSATFNVNCAGLRGTYSLNVTATTGSLSHSVLVQVIVVGPPSFTIFVAPGTLTVQPGDQSVVDITLTTESGFSGPFGLTVTAPSGFTATLDPVSLEASGTSTLKISVGSEVEAGRYAVTVVGTKGVAIHSATIFVTVTSNVSRAPPQPTILGLQPVVFFSGLAVIVAATLFLAFISYTGRKPERSYV